MAILNGLGLLNSLSLGRRAVNSQQTGLHITGRNIANVNTPGYTRQRAITGVNDSRADQLTGERFPQVELMRDVLTDRLLLQERGRFGSASKQALLMRQIEGAFNEPSDSGLAQAMTRFFDAAEALANTPESAGVRAQLIERARVVTTQMRAMARQFDTIRSENVGEARLLVDEVNAKLDEVRLLNRQILQASGEAERVDIEGRQMQVLQELGELLSVRVEEGELGTRTVVVNGIALVDGSTGGRLGLVVGSGDTLSLRAEFGSSTFDLEPTGGRLQGLIETQNRTLPAIENDLHNVARTLVDQVNALHPNFFRPLTDPQERARAAAHIAVLVKDPEDVSPSSSGNPGGNDIALAIADLRNRTFAELGDTSIPGFYRELVAAVGARSAELGQLEETSTLVVQQLEMRRESISGVSLDEEAADMLLFQRGFQAAARYVQVVDDVLEYLVTRL